MDRAVHGGEPRRLDGRRRPIAGAVELERHRGGAHACATSPTSSSSVPARHGPRATGHPARPASASVSSATPVASTQSSALFSSGAGFLIVPESAPETDRRNGPRRVDQRRPRTRRRDAWVTSPVMSRFVHAEGGPQLNGALATADLIDELNLTMSPLLAGGDGPRVAVGGADVLVRVRPRPPHRRRRVVRVQPVGAAPSLLSNSISRWKSAATSKSL